MRKPLSFKENVFGREIHIPVMRLVEYFMIIDEAAPALPEIIVQHAPGGLEHIALDLIEFLDAPTLEEALEHLLNKILDFRAVTCSPLEIADQRGAKRPVQRL